MTDEKTIAAYNTQVERYATMVDGLTVDPTLLGFIDRFKARDYILDLGCGPCYCLCSHAWQRPRRRCRGCC